MNIFLNFQDGFFTVLAPVPAPYFFKKPVLKMIGRNVSMFTHMNKRNSFVTIS
jgi:hypothetical protein